MAFEFGFQKFGDEEDEDEELDFHASSNSFI
jgi:hypothetical protein